MSSTDLPSTTTEPSLDSVIKEMIAIRVTLTFIVYFSKSISPWTRILLILSMDALKNVYIFLRRPDLPVGSLAAHKLYQESDKILDTLSYWLCWIILQQHRLLLSYETTILFVVLSYRTIGTTIAVVTNETKCLIYFPDVFREFLLIFWALQGQRQCLTIILCMIAIASKIYLEYIFHVKKEGGTRITKYYVLGFVLVASLRCLLKINVDSSNTVKYKY